MAASEMAILAGVIEGPPRAPEDPFRWRAIRIAHTPKSGTSRMAENFARSASPQQSPAPINRRVVGARVKSQKV